MPLLREQRQPAVRVLLIAQILLLGLPPSSITNGLLSNSRALFVHKCTDLEKISCVGVYGATYGAM